MIKKPLVKLEGICKTYQDRSFVVLDNIDLSIFSGELISVLGVSGSGKSTLLHILALLDNYDKGKISFLFDNFNKTLKAHDIRSNYIGFIYQTHCLLKNFNVLENIMIPSILKGNSKKYAKHRAMSLLEKISMQDKKYYLPSSLSGGEAQRVAIARALINDPVLIIADEPTCNLDKDNSIKIIQLLKSFVNQGSGCIFTTHDTELIKFSDASYRLGSGDLKLI